MSFGAFSAGPYLFAGDDGYAEVELGDALVEIAVDDLDARLLAQGGLPELGGAPVASWLLARLAALTGGGLGLDPQLVEHIEGGVWVLDFVVTREASPVAKVQLQAGMIGAGVLGVIAEGEPLESLLVGLQGRLLEAPGQVEVAQIQVVDPDWAACPEDYTPPPTVGSRCRFGFDGAAYLGADNPRAR